MKRVFSFLLIFVLFCFCKTAAAYTWLPDADTSTHSRMKEKLFSATENDTAGLFLEGFTFSSTTDGGITLTGFQLFDVHSKTNDPLNALLGGNNNFTIPNWHVGQGWFFRALALYPDFSLNEHRALIFEQRLENLLTAIDEILSDRGGTDPSPVPVPTPLLLLASGLVGYFGLSRVYNR